MFETFSLRRLADMHCHFRLQPMLQSVLPVTASYSRYGLAMPNTRPRAILNADDVIWYRNEIMSALESSGRHFEFEPIMTIEIRDNTTPQMVKHAFEVGAVAGKVYPLGVTTNSDEGLKDFSNPNIIETFKAMRDLGMILLLHGEIDKPRTLVIKREEVFLPILAEVHHKVPGLKIILEHVTSAFGIRTISALGEEVAATITAHHLVNTLNDVIGDGLCPHNACMPMPKDFSDRDALIAAATSGNPKFFLGSDSAPHPQEKKECAKGACGCYTAPILPQLLVEIFEDYDALEKLNDFASGFGPDFYDLPRPTSRITLGKEEWVVPEKFDSVVPFRAGATMRWKLVP